MSNRGKAGSQIDLQVTVESTRAELSNILLEGYPQGSSIKWYSPIKETGYREFVDHSFWTGRLDPNFDSFWDGMSRPEQFWVNGGPNWDGLAVVTEPNHTKTLVLIEAKAHKGEMRSSSRACKNSLRLINEQLEKAKSLMGVKTSNTWTKSFYQNANRIAYGAILNSIGVKTEVVFVLFSNDPYWAKSDPTTPIDWDKKIQESYKYLGVTEEMLQANGIKHILIDFNDQRFHQLKKDIEQKLLANGII